MDLYDRTLRNAADRLTRECPEIVDDILEILHGDINRIQLIDTSINNLQFKLSSLQDDYNRALEKCKKKVKEYMDEKKEVKEHMEGKKESTKSALMKCHCGSSRFSIEEIDDVPHIICLDCKENNGSFIWA